MARLSLCCCANTQSLWSQSAGAITPANLMMIAGWPPELIEELIDAIQQRLVEFPQCCSVLLPSVTSLLTMTPEKIKTKQICELYISAMDKGTVETRVTVVENLLSVFEILPPLVYGEDVSPRRGA